MKWRVSDATQQRYPFVDAEVLNLIQVRVLPVLQAAGVQISHYDAARAWLAAHEPSASPLTDGQTKTTEEIISSVKAYLVPDESFPLPGFHQPGIADAPKDFVKHDGDKPLADLLPPVALLSVAKVLTFGAKKYKAHGWRTVDKRSRYAAAIQRHLLAWQSGETTDPESGLPHLAHLACSALFLLEAELLGLGEDDRWKKP